MNESCKLPKITLTYLKIVQMPSSPWPKILKLESFQKFQITILGRDFVNPDAIASNS